MWKLFYKFSILQSILRMSANVFSILSSFYSENTLFNTSISALIVFILNSMSYFLSYSFFNASSLNLLPNYSIHASVWSFDYFRNFKSEYNAGKYFLILSFIYLDISLISFVDRFKLNVWKLVSNLIVLYSNSNKGMARFSCLFSSRSYPGMFNLLSELIVKI